MLDAAVLVPALPLAGFLVLIFGGRRLGEPGAGWLATAAVGGSFLATLLTFAGLLEREGEARSVTTTLFTWIPSLGVKAAILIDPLSITMALFVTGIGALIHLYAIGYMRGDPRFPLFFAYLNLFVFSMLVLVLADNYALMFVGWEGVGACSYLLISFWFERDTAAVAGKKAFVTNRIGDVGLLLAMFVLFGSLGTLTYGEVFAGSSALSATSATVVVLLLLVGACGKSAQLPLYVWLPDAMEGPTPVSALIHAATMVTAGVYLLVRSSPLLELAPDAMTAIAIVGAATAFFAATIACAQDDIKRVLAYSTISQLGFMFLAVGSAGYVPAIFHMVTHAFFKALLFLGAGSVIHGLHHEQDMKRMGGLQRFLPWTAATFIVGWLAIAGIPPFAGFWSKDEILLAAYDKHIGLWVVGVATAMLTAYYMSRQVYLVFYGRGRWNEAKAEPEPAEAPDSAAESHEEPVPHGHGHAEDPHESPWTMLVPLFTLAALSVVGGALNLPFGERFLVLHHWIEPVIAHGHEADATSSTKLVLAVIPAVLALLAIVGARRWIGRPDQPSLEPEVLRSGWGVDAAYASAVSGPGRVLGKATVVLDRDFVDGAVNGVGTMVRAGGDQLRRVQTGYVRNYALGVAFGAVLLLGWALSRTAL